MYECVYVSGAIPVYLFHYKNTDFLNGQIASSNNELKMFENVVLIISNDSFWNWTFATEKNIRKKIIRIL